MLILQELQHLIHYTVQHLLHLLVASFTDRRDGHQRSVALLPVGMDHHVGNGLRDVRQHCLATQSTGHAIQCRLGNYVVITIIIVGQFLGDRPGGIVLQIGHHVHDQRDQHDNVFVGVFAHHCRCILAHGHHDLEGQMAPSVLDIGIGKHFAAQIEDVLDLGAQILGACFGQLNEDLKKRLVVLGFDGLGGDDDYARQKVGKILVDIDVFVVQQNVCADCSDSLELDFLGRCWFERLGKHLLDKSQVLGFLAPEDTRNDGEDSKGRFLKGCVLGVGTLEQELEHIGPLVVAVVVD